MSQTHLDACVRESLEAYFQDLHGVEPHNMYDMLIKSVESPLLEVVMRRANNNQSRAAQWLGLNRNTSCFEAARPRCLPGPGLSARVGSRARPRIRWRIHQAIHQAV